MAKKRYISDSFWSDARIENLDPLERYLYLYLLTNQHMSVCGIYEIQVKRMSFETGIEKEMVLKMIKRFENDNKVFYEDGILIIINFVKNQNISTIKDNLRKGIEREVNSLGVEKLSKLLQSKDLVRTLQGAYKDLDIPYLTLLNLTIYNNIPTNSESITPTNKTSDIEFVRKIHKQLVAEGKSGISKYVGDWLKVMFQYGFLLPQSKKGVEDIQKRFEQTIIKYIGRGQNGEIPYEQMDLVIDKLKNWLDNGNSTSNFKNSIINFLKSNKK